MFFEHYAGQYSTLPSKRHHDNANYIEAAAIAYRQLIATIVTQ